MDQATGLLKNSGELLPFRSVCISADIKGYVLGLRATMKYFNEDKDPVEVFFKLPLDSKQAIVGLTAHINGNKIRAEIQEKEQAKANYDDAIASGLTAAYGEKKTGDIFSIALGNLPGGEEAEIELQMVEELPVDAEGKVRFSLPTTFKPRYTPQGTVNPLAPIQDGATEHGKIAGFQEFLLHVFNAETVAEVSSPTHAIKVVPGTSDDFDVTLENDGNVSSDLVIQITHKSPHEPVVIIETGQKREKEGKPLFLDYPAVMVNFFPEVPHVDVSCEFIFLVDRSGSMSGGFIKSASETLVLFLKSMPEGCYFNIYGFGSSFESLFPASVLYNEETLAKATAHAQSLAANLGGTEVLPPLREIFRQPEIKGITRQIFLLTDGAVSNTTACVDEVRKNSHKARCFTFGIGSGASTELVNGIAEAGNGTAEFVKFGERLQPKVIRSLKHALQPAVTDVKVTFSTPSNIKVITSPKNLPPLFNGDKTVVYGIFELDDETKSLSGEVTLSGSLLGAVISHKLSFEIPPTSLTSQEVTSSILPVHRLAAKRLLDDMQKEKKSEADDVVKLSVEAQVISNETAFIAINEETTKPVSGSMKTYDIEPVEDLLGHQLLSVQSAMHSNIDSMICRSERLDSLQDQSDSLVAQSNMFYKSASKTKTGSGWFSGVTSTISGWFKGSAEPEPSTARSYGQTVRRSSMEADDLMDEIMEKQDNVDEINDCLMLPDELMEECNIKVFDCDEDENEIEKENEIDEGLYSRNLYTQGPPVLPQPSVSNSSSDSIVLLQQANGSWALNESLSTAVGITLAAIQSSCPSECDKTVWATVLAVVILKVKYLSQQDEWDLVVGKAKSWLKGHTSSETELDDLMKIAEKVVKTKN